MRHNYVNPFAPQLFNPFMQWVEFATKSMEMFISSGQVISTRVNQMARAGANPSSRDMKEFALMGSEKVKAATESGLAVATGMQSAHYHLMTRGWPHWVHSMPVLANAALKPFHGGSTANARRLSRTRRSTR